MNSARNICCLFVAVVVGCGAPPVDQAGDAAARDSDATVDPVAPDAGVPDSGPAVDSDLSATHCPGSEVVEPAEVKPLRVDAWSVASATGAAVDALEAGAFDVPGDGDTAYGTTWAVRPGDEPLEVITQPPLFAATTVSVESPVTVFVRAKRVSRFWLNGAVVAGNPYRFGNKRIPIPLAAGDNVVVAEFGGRGDGEVEFFRTRDAVAFNPEDVTAPDLRHRTTTAQPLGVMVMNLSGRILRDVTARVVETDRFEATAVTYPSLPADAVTQIGFELKPTREWPLKGATFGVRIRLESCDLAEAYETTVQLGTVNADEPFKRTFRSPVDDSVQYYAVVPPSNFLPEREYALTLSLHGASVRARGQARAYSARDWTYVVAPTNRRRFGFDWEEWGRLNGIAALEHAQSIFDIDPTRVYVTGHSMGGHGTWHFGALFPGRFAAVAPSAGWSSFYSYSGRARPTGAFARARAASDTLVYLPNLARRGAYILHGEADRNVPVEEGRLMRDELLRYTDDVVYHEEPGAGHWWDGPVAEGTDCVDWPPLFDFLREHTLDPTELDFEFRTPAPWVSPTHSYATIVASETPMRDSLLTSSRDAESVTLATDNVRVLELDGAALQSAGVSRVIVDGESHEVTGEPITVGEPGGKTLGVSGPFNQAFHRPFCFVLPDDEPGPARAYAAYLTSRWALQGNGHACALTVDDVTTEIRETRNLVYVDVPSDEVVTDRDLPFGWDDESVTIGPSTFRDAAGAFVFGDGERLSAAIAATDGSEHLLFRHSPFSSTAGIPDYLVWDDQGAAAAGFFDSRWEFDPELASLRSE